MGKTNRRRRSSASPSCSPRATSTRCWSCTSPTRPSPPSRAQTVGRPRRDPQAALESFLAVKPRMEGTIEKVLEAGDTALVANRWRLSGTAPDGSPVQMAATSADVLRRRPDGSWGIVIDDPWGAAVAGGGPPAPPARRAGPPDPGEPRLPPREGLAALERAAAGGLRARGLPGGPRLLRLGAAAAVRGGRPPDRRGGSPRAALEADDDHDGALAERDGLVERHADESDRRATRVHLSREGLAASYRWPSACWPSSAPRPRRLWAARLGGDAARRWRGSRSSERRHRSRFRGAALASEPIFETHTASA